jgi:para-aminobenzoate synthetase/4-amino-4-deoxychorismate lyase
MSELHRPEALWAAFDFPRHPLAREDGERVRGAFYAPPARWLRAERLEQVAEVLAEAQAAARAGAWVLGGLRYEAAPAFDAALVVRAGDRPLAEFAVYLAEPQAWPASAAEGTGVLGWHDCQSDADEAVQIERIREYIRAGDCYQVNLTTRIRPEAAAPDLGRAFLALHASQPGGFSLFLREAGVASVSPELFFDWRALPEGPRTWLLAAQPMKGTAPRGRDVVEDEAAQAYLRTSEKERAENLMIVDLLRNDMGRIAALGSVRVPRLFELHALPTVWQMTSTVTAVSRPGTTLAEVFAALFPCGSVTGAPKVRAMEIIAELEPERRGWYCGALGLIQPGGVASFNVPIRTVEQGADGSLRCGIGSAITLDSSAEAEIAEWRAKMRFLRRAEAPIAALETLRLQVGEFVRLPAHLARLQRTCHHFGIKLQVPKVRQALADVAAEHATGAWRVRLSVAADGFVQTEMQALADTPLPVSLALAPRPIETDGAAAEFIQHKTTRRELYEAFAPDKPAGAFDLLLWNARGELTEGTFGNIALQIDGQWLTPAVACGLLPGVLREELLAQGRISEARLSRDDLLRATGLAFFNSLRGWCPAVLLPSDPNAACPVRAA